MWMAQPCNAAGSFLISQWFSNPPTPKSVQTFGKMTIWLEAVLHFWLMFFLPWSWLSFRYVQATDPEKTQITFEEALEETMSRRRVWNHGNLELFDIQIPLAQVISGSFRHLRESCWNLIYSESWESLGICVEDIALELHMIGNFSHCFRVGLFSIYVAPINVHSFLVTCSPHLLSCFGAFQEYNSMNPSKMNLVFFKAPGTYQIHTDLLGCSKSFVRDTLQETNISQHGKSKIIFKHVFSGGYVSSLEGNRIWKRSDVFREDVFAMLSLHMTCQDAQEHLARSARIIRQPRGIADSPQVLLRELPGTPRNGTLFWEASHTIPIPLP